MLQQVVAAARASGATAAGAPLRAAAALIERLERRDLYRFVGTVVLEPDADLDLSPTGLRAVASEVAAQTLAAAEGRSDSGGGVSVGGGGVGGGGAGGALTADDFRVDVRKVERVSAIMTLEPV